MITFLRTNTSKKFVVYCMKIRDELLGIAKYVLRRDLLCSFNLCSNTLPVCPTYLCIIA